MQEYTEMPDPALERFQMRINTARAAGDFQGMVQALNEMQIYLMNQSDGMGTGCPDCNGRGWTAILRGDEQVIQYCHCHAPAYNSESANLPEPSTDFKLDTPTAEKQWKIMQRFLAEPEEHWMFLGGTPGSGKTMAATYTAQELLKAGKAVLFKNWPAEYRRVTGLIGEGRNVNAELEPMKNVEVLVLDDVFRKTGSDYELGSIYEVLNHRYNKKMMTIITSERVIKTIRENVDAGLGGRISEMSYGYALNIQDPKADRR